jgi:hypothetical protein
MKEEFPINISELKWLTKKRLLLLQDTSEPHFERIFDPLIGELRCYVLVNREIPFRKVLECCEGNEALV